MLECLLKHSLTQ